MSASSTIIAIAAVTIDGRIARRQNEFTNWTSDEDKDVLHEHLDNSDVIVVGNNTYKTAEEKLSKRNCVVFTRSVKAPEQVRDNLVMLNPIYKSPRDFLIKYPTVALLGGTEIYSYFLRQGLVNEIYLTIEPLVFGRGLPFSDCKSDLDLNFELVSVKQLNKKGSLLLHYK